MGENSEQIQDEHLRNSGHFCSATLLTSADQCHSIYKISICPETITEFVLNFCSLRFCRSSSMNLFDLGEGNFAGNLSRISQGFFRTHQIKAQNFRVIFRSIFR